MASSTGFAAAKASLLPPAMKVSVAPLAPPTPPDTGASIDGSFRAAASACALRALSTSMVEQSISSVPSRAAGTSSAHTDMHMLARRQHGDDDVGGLRRLDRRGRDRNAVGLRRVA